MSSEPSRLELAHNTPVPTTPSAFSDIKSTVTSSDHKRSDVDTATGNPESAPVHPEFAFADGNIEIRATDQSFWVHEYHLNKFSVFATLIQTAKNSETALAAGRRITVVCDKRIKAGDIYNTLKVIYASHIDGIPDFDPNIMTSTLRISSAFGYPSLRKFAISKLEEMNLRAIQRIQLSDEFSLPSFETPAFTELCSRREPITIEEASVLGISRFVEIARIREEERTRWAANAVKGGLLQVLDSSLKPESSMDGNSADEFGQLLVLQGIRYTYTYVRNYLQNIPRVARNFRSVVVSRYPNHRLSDLQHLEIQHLEHSETIQQLIVAVFTMLHLEF
ncbi:hypothetical protein FRC11_014176 [Ceratobasidium sp. 423]|nr:hypothetical protein FRC11_014176 [Ceratobasidium sp. 423]